LRQGGAPVHFGPQPQRDARAHAATARSATVQAPKLLPVNLAPAKKTSSRPASRKAQFKIVLNGDGQ
jgi:hypothetical protein